MKFILEKSVIFICMITLCCTSCGDKDLFDTDKWSDQIEGEWTPGINGAIAYGNVSLWDLLQNTSDGEDSPIQKVPDPNNQQDSILVIKYTEENIYNLKLDDVFHLEGSAITFSKKLIIPDKLKELLKVAGGRVDLVDDEFRSFSETIQEEVLLPAEFAESSLSKMELDMEVSYDFPRLDDVTYKVEVVIGGTSVLEKLVEGRRMYGTERITREMIVADGNMLELEYKVKLISGTYKNADLDLSVALKKYSFNFVEGKILRSNPIQITGDPFKIENDFLNEVEGNVEFLYPQVFVNLKNKGIGVDANVSVSFVKENGVELSLSGEDKLFFAGNKMNSERVISDLIDKNNAPGITQFFSLPLNGDISYNGDVVFNTAKKADCVVYADGTLGMDVDVVIPLALKGELLYRDTLTDINVEQKYADKIESAKLVFRATKNDLKIDLSIPKIVLLNEAGESIGEIKVSESDGSRGILKAHETGDLVFLMDKSTAKKLGQTEKMLLEVCVANDDSNMKPVLSNDRVEFSLLLDAKAKIEDLDF